VKKAWVWFWWIVICVPLLAGAIWALASRGSSLGLRANDCEKYRLAAYLGWTVLRFTTKCITAANVADAVDFFNKRIRQAVRDEGYAV